MKRFKIKVPGNKWKYSFSFVMTSILLMGTICLFGSPAVLSKTKYSNEELSYLPAVELLEMFKKQEISPVQVLKAQIEQIEKLDGGINAITTKHYDEALKQAKESELRYQNGNPRPLEGITCAIKDDVEVKGWRMTKGSLVRKDALPALKDSPLASLLKDAGVVMHVQTNIPECYCNLVTWNKINGICRNPWNTMYTPGGSSGGSAAALASGFTTLATGSDMGGSIRFPAAMTGLYGFKPPYGRVSTSMIQYESLGPMARTFEDLVIFQNAMTGPNPKMISTLKPKMNYLKEYENIKGWKIAYDPMSNWGLPLDDTIREAMNKVVEKLREQGATVDEIDLGFRASDFDTYASGIFSTAIGPFCFNETRKNISQLTPYFKEILNKYDKSGSPQHIANADDWIDKHNDEVQQKVFLKDYRIIIMPTMCTPYVKADMGTTNENLIVTINGKSHSSKTWIYSFTWPWNMLGQYPVLNVPIGLTHDGIPLGMQVIANTYDDMSAFHLGFNWAKITPKFYSSNGMTANTKQKGVALNGN